MTTLLKHTTDHMSEDTTDHMSEDTTDYMSEDTTDYMSEDTTEDAVAFVSMIVLLYLCTTSVPW